MPDLNAIRAQLEARVASLTSRHEKMEAHLHNRDRTLPNDWTDRATVTENDQVLEQLDEAALGELAGIKAAIGRIADGTFGTCVTCGEDIDERRLAALPTSPLCIECAKDQA